MTRKCVHFDWFIWLQLHEFVTPKVMCGVIRLKTCPAIGCFSSPVPQVTCGLKFRRQANIPRTTVAAPSHSFSHSPSHSPTPIRQPRGAWRHQPCLIHARIVPLLLALSRRVSLGPSWRCRQRDFRPTQTVVLVPPVGPGGGGEIGGRRAVLITDHVLVFRRAPEPCSNLYPPHEQRACTTP